MTTPTLEPRPVPDPAPEPPAGTMDWDSKDLHPTDFKVDWERLLTWPSTTPRDPRPGAPDPGPIPKPNPYPTGPRG